MQKYESQAKELKNTQLTNYQKERLGKELIQVAKDIVKDPYLLGLLKRDAPKVAEHVNSYIAQTMKQVRGHNS